MEHTFGLLACGWMEYGLALVKRLDIGGVFVELLTGTLDFVISPVEAFGEVYLMLLVLIVRVGVVEDVVGSRSSIGRSESQTADRLMTMANSS